MALTDTPETPAIPHRDPKDVMRLARLGSMHQSRLSFMRILLRGLKSGNWRFKRSRFDVNDAGVGVAVYTAHGPERSYSLIAYAHDLPAHMRSDRVIATAWDATFTLFDGVPGDDDITRLSQHVPKQELARLEESELSLSRANRSVRLWDYVVDCLSQGVQPDADRIDAVGYLMRTTAVYGSGKFGAADREVTENRPECKAPFQVEMLSVYLTRAFVMDLVEHMARTRNPDGFVPMDPKLRRRFGIGNSTGLGMAPFLINHPSLLNNWITAREEALSRVRSVAQASDQAIATFRSYAWRAQQNALNWISEHPLQIDKIAALRTDMAVLCDQIDRFDFTSDYPWNRLWLWGEAHLGLEGQEQLSALLLEPYPELVDALSATMSADEAQHARIDGTTQMDQIRADLERTYGWALSIDWTAADPQANVWYVSEEKLEPRLGDRSDPDVAPFEQPLSPGRDAARMFADASASTAATLGAFLMQHPEHRHMARRLQVTARLPFAEICDNTIAADLLPIDMLRAKLSFFGANHFDPRSDRWLRIKMFLNAPYPDELSQSDPDDWVYPAAEPVQ